jgi:hypothetical protein
MGRIFIDNLTKGREGVLRCTEKGFDGGQLWEAIEPF